MAQRGIAEKYFGIAVLIESFAPFLRKEKAPQKNTNGDWLFAADPHYSS
jgi:hypothetical protein